MSSPKSSGPGAAGSAAAETDPLIGTVLSDRYRLDALLGEGGMGKVYSAEHVLMRKRLAVKILHRELTAVPEVVARFEREAMAAANIDHPNVAAATDFGKLSDGSVFLVLEFVQGRNLRDEIAQGPMHVERALLIARQISSALNAAHGLDIVHRDLKPENVMLVEKGGDPDFVKVLDFGIAKVPIGETHGDSGGKPITKVGMVFGTPEYMAPEQALGQPVDGRADVYALGVILYEMLAGVRPFSSKSPVGILGQQLSKSPPAVAERVPGLFVPPAVEHLLQRLLAREADERVASAADAVSAMEALLGHAPGSGARLFTMAAGSPAAPPPSSPHISSIPDLEAPIPILMPPNAAARMPFSSSPDVALSSSPGGVAVQQAPPRESFPSSPSSANWLPSQPGSIPDFGSSPGSIPGVPSSPDPLEADIDGYGPASALGGPRAPSPADRFRVALDDIVARAKRGLDRAYAFVDEKRALLPPKVREPLENVPARALLATAAVFVVGALFVFVVLVGVIVGASKGSPKTAGSAAPSATASAVQGSTTPPEDGPSEEELAKARSGGEAALAKLASKYPKSSTVLLAVLKQQLADKKHVEAVATVGKALAQDPTLNENPEIASALWATAQAKDSSDAAFALLEGPMGKRGADLVYDLSRTKGIRSAVKQRSVAWLGSEAFQKQSSPALNVLVALEAAKTCRQRHALLMRAKNVGDDRVLALVKTYEKKTGCGRRGTDDCQSCMRSDSLLTETISALQARQKK